MSRRFKIVLFMLWVLAMAGAGYVLLNSPFFSVTEVQVLGCLRTSPDEIVAASGILEGANIFSVPLGEAAERIAAIPWVQSVTCMRRFPATVGIQVIERKPAAVTPHHNSFMVLDPEGWVVEVRDRPGGLPLVTVEPVPEMHVGEQVDSEALRWAIACAQAFGPRSNELAEVHADEKSHLTVYMTGGLRAMLGQADSTLERKVGLLLGIINDIRGNGVDAEYVDLRYEKPVVKTRSGAQSSKAAGGVNPDAQE
ncbi:MAG: cell division protein FtsQ/DivIB [Ignavibacteriales bacterium]